MNTYSETLEYLYRLQRRGMKFGLRNIETLLASVGNPHRRFQSIHIAGTNGKGSTAAFLSSILMESGYKTGLYTSPHLQRFTERIRINGKEISQRRLVSYAQQLRPAIESTKATFFEATTCIAFQYFADEHVELAVIETGLGGRLDATNVLSPMISVITNIGLEHREYLGNTITAITREKAGIIKRGIPCVTGSGDKHVLKVLNATCARTNTKLHQAGGIVSTTTGPGKGQRTTFRTKPWTIRNVRLGLAGPHQVQNASLAVACLAVLKGRADSPPPFERVKRASVKTGLERVSANSGIRARLETLGLNGRYIVDVAHNPDGSRTLVDALELQHVGGLIVVFGVMKDKEYLPMLRELARVGKAFVAVAPAMDRALNPRKLCGEMRRLGLEARWAGSVGQGLGIAIRMAGTQGRVLVTGSHYVVGEAYPRLRKKA